MKNAKVLKSKKGFTIIELVIVIAVIAILAAILIPTFTSVIEKSHRSNAITTAKSCYTEFLAENGTQPKDIDEKLEIKVNVDGKDYVFKLTAQGQLDVKTIGTAFTASGTPVTGTYKIPASSPPNVTYQLAPSAPSVP